MTAREECRWTYSCVRMDRQPRGRFMFGRAIAFRHGSIAPWLDQSGSAARAAYLIEAADHRRSREKSLCRLALILVRESLPAARLP